MFDETHGLALSLVREGVVDALRIDHPDGLADPAQYLERLRSGGAGTVWIEKILESGERLRDWPVTGTVGYEFLNDVCALFVDARAEPTFTRLWHELSGDARGFDQVALEAKLEQATTTFTPEVQRLERSLDAGAEELAAAVASMPVYRSYVEPLSRLVAEQDRRWITASGMAPAIASRLLLEHPSPPEFVTRFQQTTPAVVAKGVEDTAFYRYARQLALCDVGGDPGRFGLSVEGFHAANAERAERFPLGMLATTTHDTKRSADVRARIAALTWIPEAWEQHVRRWLALTESLRGERRRPGRRRARTSCFRPWSAPGRSSPSGSSATWRRRCAKPSATAAGSTPNGDWERDGARVLPGALRQPRVPGRLRAVRRARGAAR